MKTPILPLILRNGIVAAIFLCLLVAGSVFFSFKYIPRGFPVLLLLLTGVIWANIPLIKRRPILAIVLSLILVPTLAALCSIFAFPLSRSFAERSYRARGFQLVNGCNGGAANGADGQVHTLKMYLADLAEENDTNDVANLQMALKVAEEKARILGEDCARRGHCENKPWKTNWVVVKETLSAYEEKLFHQ